MIELAILTVYLLVGAYISYALVQKSKETAVERPHWLLLVVVAVTWIAWFLLFGAILVISRFRRV